MRYISKGVYYNGQLLKDTGFEVIDGVFKEILPNEDMKRRGKSVSLDGYVYPAFIESHAHIGEVHNMLTYVDGSTISSEKELEEAIQKSDPAFIFNVDFNRFPKETFRRLFFLNRCLFIQSKDEHSVFVSKKFLTEKGIVIKDGEDISSGLYDGTFIGILKDKATDYVKSLKIVKPTEESIKRVEDYFLSRGIVSITNFDYYFKDYLPMINRLNIVQGISLEHLDDAVSEGIKTGDKTPHFIYGPLKVFLDGSLGSQTASMYEDKPFKGILLLDDDAFYDVVKKANENGIKVAVHAIGSRSIHIALSVFKKVNIVKDNRIEHLQFIDERDYDLLKETPFIPSMQPYHAVSDEYLFKKYLGSYRLAYAWLSVYTAKGVLIFGSDAPVEDASVLKGLYAATHNPLSKEESIPLHIALSAYTEWGSIYNYLTNTGKIERGFYAHFAVLKMPLHQNNLLDNEVVATAKGGEIVWMK